MKLENISILDVLFYFSSIMLVLSALFVGFSRTTYKIIVSFFIQLFSASFVFYFLHAEYLALVTMFIAVSGAVLTFSFSRTLGVGLRLNLNGESKKSRRIILTLIGLLLGTTVASSTIFGVFNVIDWSAKTESSSDFDAKRYGMLLVEKYPIAFELSGIMILLAVVGSLFLLRERKGDEA